MNLIIDIGNTCAKLTLFDGTAPVAARRVERGIEAAVADVLSRYRPERCAWSCVGAETDEVRRTLTALPVPSLHVTGLTPTPLRNAYRSPATLGADRLAAVVGAAGLVPRTNLLVVDAGTCITYDLVDATGTYRGGNISPGADMRLAAMHEHTAHLPLVDACGDMPDVGYDTETALRAGVALGIRYEMEGYVRSLAGRYPGLRLFLTGGDSLRLDLPRESIQTDEHLVARGLNSILLYNENI